MFSVKTTRPFARTIAVIFGASALAVSVQAAPVTFSKPVVLSGEHDIVTTGTLDRAVSFGGLVQTVGGVKFAAGNQGAGQSLVEIDTTTLEASADNYVAMGGSATFTGKGGDFGGLSEAYKNLLGSGAYASTTKGTLTLAVHNLTKGATYLIQFFVNDSRNANRHETVRSGGTGSEVIAFSSTGANGGVGQSVVGTFTADDQRQEFVFTPEDTASDDAQINAFQLRVVPASSVPASAAPRKGK